MFWHVDNGELTPLGLGLLKIVGKEFGLKNVWILDGQIVYMDKSLQKLCF